MGKVVDHDERRQEILRKALQLFSDMGYQQVTFQQLAEVCGLSRTAFYKYFSSKKEIFDEALYHLVQGIGEDVKSHLEKHSMLSASEKLELVLQHAIDTCLKDQALLRTIVEYLIAQRRQGESVERKIMKHTATFRYEINSIIHEGIASGEFKSVSPIMTTDILFCLLQSVVIRIMFYNDTDRDKLMQHCEIIIQAIKANDNKQ